MGNGAQLGTAVGRITIETSDLERAGQSARAAARQIEQALSGIGTGTQKAERSIESLSAAMNRLGGSFGLITGVGAAAAVGRFALQSDTLATAYKRQSVAAVSLAGSQEQLNQLLIAYDKTTGGVIDKASALGDVVRLQAVGFADSTAELERFTTAARGISLATGRTQDYVISQMQLAIANQSELRLDQIGLGVTEVQQRIAQLKAADSSLTGEMIYQNAILSLAEEKFGALTKSTAAQAVGAEQAAKAWKDFSLALGQAFGPAIGGAMKGAADQINGIRQNVEGLTADLQRIAAIMAAIRGGDWSGYIQASIGLGNSILGRTPLSERMGTGVADIARPAIRPGIGGAAADPRAGDRQAAILDFERQIQDIERSAQEQRIDATTSYESQRSETIANYERSIAREAEDFGRQRQRAQEELFRQIGDIEEAGTRQAAEWAESLNERVAEIQGDGNERLSELEEDYQRNRERRERDHRDRLFNAAARLDAVAVANEQRQFARQNRDAEEAHDEQVSDLQEQLSERIAQENKAHQERLKDAREADARRIADMREDFVRRQAEENADRAIRQQRAAEDHTAQLAQMDAAQGERLAQINRHEAEERKAAENAHLMEMQQLGVVLSKGWKLVQDAIEAAALKSYDEYKKELDKRYGIQGPATRAEGTTFAPGMFDGLTSPLPNGPVPGPSPLGRSGASVRIDAGAIVVYGAVGQSETAIAKAVGEEMERIFRGMMN